MEKGWISLHRKIQENPIWTINQPFDYRSAWIDLLMLANHEDKEVVFDYKPIMVKRGQILTSVRKLGERWKWGKERTLKYFRLLEQLEMVTKDSTNRRTLLTIENYGKYQDDRDTDEDTPRPTNRTLSDPQTEHWSATNNNNNSIYINNNKDILSGNSETEKIREIVDYLNAVLGSRYRASSKNLSSMIKARLSEGHTVDDFKCVVDKKHRQWKSDPKMVGYLRPETLFCAKHFDSYLNEKEVEQKTQPAEKPKNGFHNFGERKYNFADLEEEAWSN